MLIVVTNNKWGISTHYQGQHGEKRISDRGKAFGIESKTIDGNDPEVSYRELSAAMERLSGEQEQGHGAALNIRLHERERDDGMGF